MNFFASKKTLITLAIVLVGALTLVPLFFVFWNSLKDLPSYTVTDLSLQNWSLGNFIKAYDNLKIIQMIMDSFIFAFGSMLVSFILGGTLAFLVERTNTPFRNAVYGIMLIPLAIPGVLKAIAWILLLSPKIGLLNQVGLLLGFSGPIFNAYTIAAMFWVQGLAMAPLTFLLMGASFRAMDPAFEEAAMTSGAGRIFSSYHITFKLMIPALVGTAILQFVYAMEVFDIPMLMGLPNGILVFSTNIYFALRELTPPQYGQGYAFSITLIAICLIGMFFYRRFMTHSERYTTITGKGYRPRIMNLGKFRPVAGAFVLFFVFVNVILPIFIIVWASLLPFYQTVSIEALQHLNLDNYRELFRLSDFITATKNTVIMGVSVALTCIILAVIVSWMVIRLPSRQTSILDSLLFIPYAMPSIVIGFSFMVFFLTFPNPVYGTLWIMIVAYAVKYLPILTRFTHAGVAQVGKELEDAAEISGANLYIILRKITGPLILPSIIGGGIFVFMLAVKVMSIAVLLYTADTAVLSVLIFEQWQAGSIGVTAAIAVILFVALFIMAMVSRKLLSRVQSIDTESF